MDTSKEYIEMCEKAKEIQDLWEYQYGDFMIVDYTKTRWNNDVEKWVIHNKYACKEFVESFKIISADYPERGVPKVFWLPRQDQLQDMLTELSPKGRFVFLMKWMDESLWCNKRLNCDTSAEIIWLVCIMDRKFNKVWDGKEWIKKNG